MRQNQFRWHDYQMLSHCPPPSYEHGFLAK
jgi:hypothetical protein